jgi:predicted MFS family arabinose efflux permease
MCNVCSLTSGFLPASCASRFSLLAPPEQTIGIGWNWGFVSATAALVESVEGYTPAEQTKAKGFNDLLIQLLGAVGTLLTGFATSAWGWEVLVRLNSGLIFAQLVVLLMWLSPSYCKSSSLAASARSSQ